MMNKMKSARAQLIKFLFIVPLIAVMLLAFRNERNKNTSQNNQTGHAAWQTPDFTDSVPPPPPVPPVPPAAPKLPSNVKSLNITDDEATILLKDGTREKYDLNNKKEAEAFHKKYGSLLIPPPPPPPPHAGAGYTIAPGAIIDESNVHALSPRSDVTVAVGTNVSSPNIAVTGGANTITAVNTPILSEVNVHGVSVAGTTPVHAVVPLKEVVLTGYPLKTALATNVPVAVNVPRSATAGGLSEVNVSGYTITQTGIEGEKELELKIYKFTTREKLDQLIAEAEAKGIELKFDNIEYDKNGRLARLGGKLEKGNSKSTFNLTDFEVLSLMVTKENGHREPQR